MLIRLFNEFHFLLELPGHAQSSAENFRLHFEVDFGLEVGEHHFDGPVDFAVPGDLAEEGVDGFFVLSEESFGGGIVIFEEGDEVWHVFIRQINRPLIQHALHVLNHLRRLIFIHYYY